MHLHTRSPRQGSKEPRANNGMIIPVGGTFAGQLDGSLNRATQTLSGDWALTVDGDMGMEQGTCTGTWTAVLQP